MTSAELHVDIACTIFETDIAPKIAEIRATLAQPDSPLLLGELRAQFDVLAGLGEILNFPALVRISRLALAALTYHPDQAVAIGALALGDLERMEQNPEPDPELVALSELPLDGWDGPELSSFGGDEASPGEAAITSPLSVWEEIGSFVEAASPPYPE